MTTAIRRRLERATTKRDSGTALVLALLIILLVGTLLAVALDMVRNGLSIQPNVLSDRNESNYMQGAVEGAINNIRGSSTSGRAGAGYPCPTFYAPGTSDVGAAGSFKVTCEGKTSPGGVGSAVQPDWAIQTVDPSAGMGIHQEGNDQVTIDGGIFSAGDLTISDGTGGSHPRMDVFGSVYAHEQCHDLAVANPPKTPRLTSTDPIIHCPYPTSGPLNVTPSWPAALDQTQLTSFITSANADPIPTCTGNGVITFPPGYYGVKPDDLVDKYQPTCKGTVMHFTPGNYYFDYAGTWNLAQASYSPPGNVIKVVGGTKTTDALLTGRQMGVACDESAAGVQFMFGGDSKINVDGTGAAGAAEGLELCAPLSNAAGTPQRISIYGVASGPAAATPASGNLQASSPVGVVKTGAATLVAGESTARRLDDSGASALMTFGNGGTAALTLTGFSGPTSVPPGAKITKITVRTASRQALASELIGLNDTASGEFVLKSGGSTIGQSDFGTSTCAPCDRDVYTGAAGGPTWRDLAGLQLTYTARGASGNSALSGMSLDGLELIVSWTAPTLRPLTCTSPSCPAVITTGTNPRVWLHGTVFAPTARINIRVHNGGDTVFGRGIVVRTLDFDMNASSKQEDAPFQLPTATAGRRVLFKAYAPGESDPRVRACVVFTDTAPSSVPGGKFTAFPGWSLVVERWRVLRRTADGDSCS